MGDAQKDLKQKMATVSLIITTYNRPDVLDLVLTSKLRQNHVVDQAIVADDGSLPETTVVVSHECVLIYVYKSLSSDWDLLFICLTSRVGFLRY